MVEFIKWGEGRTVMKPKEIQKNIQNAAFVQFYINLPKTYYDIIQLVIMLPYASLTKQ